MNNIVFLFYLSYIPSEQLMTHKQTRQFNGSLQERFLGYSILATLLMSLVLYFSNDYTSNKITELIHSIEHSNEIKEDVIQMRNHVTALSNGINSVMNDPAKADQIRLIFQASFNELNHLINKLNQLDYIDGTGITGHLIELTGMLDELYVNSSKLIEIRKNIHQQFPAMEVSNRLMRSARDEMFRILSITHEEMSNSDPNYKGSELYDLIMESKYLLTYTISEYRLYLAFRLGSFNDENLFDQEEIVYAFTDNLRAVFQKIQTYRENLGFESQGIIKNLTSSLEKWVKGYEEVKSIHHSDKWRTDVYLMEENVLPILDNISTTLINIDQLLKEKNALQASEFKSIYDRYEILGYLIIGFFFLFVAMMIILVKKLVFSPLNALSLALNDKQIKFNSPEIQTLHKTDETKSLIQSFEKMHAEITARQEELSYQALHDNLTGLPNRKLLNERLEQSIEMADRDKHKLSFLMLDLNGFKQVNDTLGHHVGDILLVEVSKRLKSLMRKSDTIARLGGDEFSIILP
ncbi:MAG: GGDEF domain-containing protein, partial [Gammaproteobacteria bacterium]